MLTIWATVLCEICGISPLARPGLSGTASQFWLAFNRHLLRHLGKQAPVATFHAPEQTAELAQRSRVFARAAPRAFGRRPALGQVGQFERLLAVVEELIQGNFEGAGELLQRLDRRDGVPVLNAGDVAADQARALLDVPLRELLFLAQCAEAVADYRSEERRVGKEW